jgi:hypothetical protein
MQERDELEQIQQTRGWAIQHLLTYYGACKENVELSVLLDRAKEITGFCLNLDIGEAKALSELRAAQNTITVEALKKRAQEMKVAQQEVDGDA